MVLHHPFYKPQWSEFDNCTSQCKASCCVLLKSEKIHSIMIFLKIGVNFNCCLIQFGEKDFPGDQTKRNCFQRKVAEHFLA